MSTREMLNLLGLQACTYDQSLSARKPIVNNKRRVPTESKKDNTPQYTNEQLIKLFQDATLVLNSLRERNKNSCHPEFKFSSYK